MGGNGQTVPSAGGRNGSANLGRLRERVANLGERIERGLKFLNDLSARTGQDTPEFNRYFAEWSALLDEERKQLDALDAAEVNAALRARLVEADRIGERLHDSILTGAPA
jgi:hypothetical protein